MGSFSQGRSKTTVPKGCHELIPSPSDLLLLCVLGLGWGPGKTRDHFWCWKPCVLLLLFYCVCLASLLRRMQTPNGLRLGALGQRGSARGKTVLRVMAVDQRLRKSKARKGGGSKRRCSKRRCEGLPVGPPTTTNRMSFILSPSVSLQTPHTQVPPLNETCFLHHLFFNVILISLYHTWVWEKGSARSWGSP